MEHVTAFLVDWRLVDRQSVDEAIVQYILGCIEGGEMDAETISEILWAYFPKFEQVDDKTKQVAQLMQAVLNGSEHCPDKENVNRCSPDRACTSGSSLLKGPDGDLRSSVCHGPAPTSQGGDAQPGSQRTRSPLQSEAKKGRLPCPAATVNLTQYAVCRGRDEDLEFLAGMMPHVGEEALRYVLHQLCAGSRADAAQYLVENSAPEDVRRMQAHAAEWGERTAKEEADRQRDVQALKHKIVGKFGDSVIQQSGSASKGAKPAFCPVPVYGGDKTKIRYRDNMVATTKGEKIIIEQLKPEWDGGSKGKVKSKGKRGKGFV